MTDDDDIPWSGPNCPTCGRELDAVPTRSTTGLAVAYVCTEHGFVRNLDPLPRRDL